MTNNFVFPQNEWALCGSIPPPPEAASVSALSRVSSHNPSWSLDAVSFVLSTLGKKQGGDFLWSLSNTGHRADVEGHW